MKEETIKDLLNEEDTLEEMLEKRLYIQKKIEEGINQLNQMKSEKRIKQGEMNSVDNRIKNQQITLSFGLIISFLLVVYASVHSFDYLLHKLLCILVFLLYIGLQYFMDRDFLFGYISYLRYEWKPGKLRERRKTKKIKETETDLKEEKERLEKYLLQLQYQIIKKREEIEQYRWASIQLQEKIRQYKE